MRIWYPIPVTELSDYILINEAIQIGLVLQGIYFLNTYKAQGFNGTPEVRRWVGRTNALGVRYQENITEQVKRKLRESDTIPWEMAYLIHSYDSDQFPSVNVEELRQALNTYSNHICSWKYVGNQREELIVFECDTCKRVNKASGVYSRYDLSLESALSLASDSTFYYDMDDWIDKEPI